MSAIPSAPGASAAAARAAERGVVLGYVPLDRRAGFAALLALDDVLAGIVRTTREPMVGQMRLTWWHEALQALDEGGLPVGEPVLAAIAGDVLPRGGSGTMLSAMIDGWEVLIGPEPVDLPRMQQFARARGGTLFAALAGLQGGTVDAAVMRAGEGWALTDLAVHLRDPAQAALARSLAAAALDHVFQPAWAQPLRPVGMLAILARADLDTPSPRPGSPRRLARLLMHRIWGR